MEGEELDMMQRDGLLVLEPGDSEDMVGFAAGCEVEGAPVFRELHASDVVRTRQKAVDAIGGAVAVEQPSTGKYRKRSGADHVGRCAHRPYPRRSPEEVTPRAPPSGSRSLQR